MSPRRFEATLEARGGGGVVELPFDLKEVFGRARRRRVEQALELLRDEVRTPR